MNFAQSSLPARQASLWGETTVGEVALLILGGVFTLVLLAVFFWITFRALREKP